MAHRTHGSADHFPGQGDHYGLKQATVPLDKINAVSGETGIFFGKITIEDGAGSRVITNVWKKTVIAFTNKTREAMNDIRRPRSVPE